MRPQKCWLLLFKELLVDTSIKRSSHGGLVVEIVLGDAMVPGSIPGVVAETNIVSCVDDFQSTKLSWKTKLAGLLRNL